MINKMKKIFLYAAALFSVACSNVGGDGTTAKPDNVRVSPSEVTVSRKGGTGEVLVTSNGSWSVSEADASWAVLSKSEGEDGDVLTLTVEKNEATEARTATFTLSQGTAKGTLTVKQQGKADPSLGEYIEIAPEAETVAADGNKVQVIVTSTGEWKLSAAATYAWVTTDRTSGEDGDVVLFTIFKNETEEEREAQFTFKNGDAEATLTLTQQGQPKDYLTLTSGSTVDVKTVGGTVAVTFDTSYGYRDLQQEITGDNSGWLTFAVAQPDKTGKNAVLNFTAAENPNDTDRVATVTVKSPDGALSSTIKLTQFRKPVLSTEKSIYTADIAGGDITIPITSNVEYKATVSADAQSWLSVKSSNDKQVVITVKSGSDAAQGEVTLKHESELGGELEYTFAVLRKAPSLIEYVPDWTNQRAWPSNTPWYRSEKLGGSTGLQEFTCEALVKMDIRRPTGGLSTVFGIEGTFLIRFGDASVDPQCLQLVRPSGNSYGSSSNNFGTSKTRIELNTWTHVAITYSNAAKKICVYFDGELVDSATVLSYQTLYPAKFAYQTHSEETAGTNAVRCFWVSYAYDKNRYWPGQMCELRIWDKVLTQDEIKAPNHFYTVENPEQNDNLVVYWKCNDNNNSGIMKDYSGNGFNLEYDTSNPFTWVPVSLGTVE